MRIAYYSPMPPERSGIADYSALLCPRFASGVDVDVARRGKQRARRRRALPRRQRAEAHGWILEASAARAGRRRPPRLRPAPPRRRADARAEGRARLSRGAWNATQVSRGGCSASASSTGAFHRSGRCGRGLSALRRGPRSRDRPDRALALRRGARARARLRRAGLARSRIPPGRAACRSAADVEGAPSSARSAT